MSQIVRIRNTRLMEKDYLLQALADLGYNCKENGRLGLLGPKVDIVARANLGFRHTAHGYQMLTRNIPVRREAELLQKLTQRYAYHAAREKLEAQGFTLASEEVQQDGRIHLVLRRMA